jgi:hypothetical protein
MAILKFPPTAYERYLFILTEYLVQGRNGFFSMELKFQGLHSYAGPF